MSKINKLIAALCNVFAYTVKSAGYFIIGFLLAYMLTARYIKDNKINSAQVVAYILATN